MPFGVLGQDPDVQAAWAADPIAGSAGRRIDGHPLLQVMVERVAQRQASFTQHASRPRHRLVVEALTQKIRRIALVGQRRNETRQ